MLAKQILREQSDMAVAAAMRHFPPWWLGEMSIHSDPSCPDISMSAHELP